MALKLKFLLVLCLSGMALSLNAAFYPLWLSPEKSEDVGTTIIEPAAGGGNTVISMLRRLRYCIENYPDSPNRAWYIFQLANGLYELHELDSAMSFFKLLEDLPDSATVADIPGFETPEQFRTEARIGIARCLTSKGETPAAVEYLNKILPRDDADRVMLAQLHFLNKRRQSASAMLAETAGEKIADPGLRLRAGMLYRELRMDDAAAALFRSLLECGDQTVQLQAAAMLKLARRPAPTRWIDGNFPGSAAADSGTLEVMVTISRGKLSKIALRNRPFAKPFTVASSLPRRMVEFNQPLVTPVRGAEAASNALMVATADALERARRD
ncbi:MAG: hypothetical protein AB7F40_10800 [Victivallaceae bacterium]|nr:hypothetical protein [Victivallaceae bacterium]